MRRTFALLTLFLPSLFAQRTVSGVVHDQQGGSIAGAAVRLQSIGGAVNQTLVTAADGRFAFNGVTGRKPTGLAAAPER